MTDFDLIVLGAGPAGINAALAASGAGLSVAIVDENGAAGGQVYRAPAVFDASDDSPEATAGHALRAALDKSAVKTYFGYSAWAVTADFQVDAVGPAGPICIRSTALIVAAGTTERVVPFEGWTTPGVIGLAAATILLKSQKVLPGKTTLVAGCGPLLAAVAAGILKAGGTVAGIADLASPADWARATPALLSRPDILRQGVKWALAIRRARVPLHTRHTLVSVVPDGPQLRAVLAPCDSAGRPVAGAHKSLLVDCVTVGHGLTPSTDITRLLRAEHHYSRASGGWVAKTDAYGLTSRERLYVVGDGAGIAGAAAAAHHGALAGLACALFQLPDRSAQLGAALKTTQTLHARSARFGRSMARLMALRPGHVDSISPDTIVCRCEDVTRAEIDAACDAGARDVNQLKAWTRCGMGPCQGRTCGDVAAEIVAAHHHTARDQVGIFSARTPLRPLSVAALTGDFVYADIPIPKAAPL
ncbi:NAD(P)/FAD-dependent oxidoreductase [Xanthomonas sp. WHRI 1810A]|uniref:NAD(P)/FAD-dependent oxidoreductase n=1 Tax=Xanthomonas sp. WHRI 1810A TaxID=3161565 RepID=UPI0032E87FCB